MDKSTKTFSFAVLSKETWANPRRARKQLLFEALLRKSAVSDLLYIDPPGHFGISYVRTAQHRPGVRVCERAYLFKGERFALIRWLNRFIVYVSVKKFLRPNTRWFTFLYNPWDLYLAGFLSRHGPVIFDWTEDWGIYYDNAVLGTQQKNAINISSGIITVTESLADKAKKLATHKKNILFLPNATAWLPVDNLQCPDEMKNIPVPRIGYCGSLGPWFDKNLVLDLAKAHPEWHWIIVGQAGQKIRDFFSKAANIHCFGLQPFKSIQSFMAHCQVLVAPYVDNISGDASKLYDYLTLGSPIVSSNIETSSRLKGHVYIPSCANEWLQLLEKAIIENNPEKRQARQQASSDHTWDTRASVLLEWLMQF